MKLWKWIVKCPILFLLLAGWMGVTVYTFTEGRASYAVKNNLIENPIFTALVEPELDLSDSLLDDFEDDGFDDFFDSDEPDYDVADASANVPSKSIHGNASKGDGDGRTDSGGTDGKDGADGIGSKTDTDDSGSEDGLDGSDRQNGAAGSANAGEKDGSTALGENTRDEEEIGITRFKKYDKTETNSPYYVDPGEKALTTEYSYQTVDKSYFDDAVFIGDSRTVGMQDYSGLTNATFFAKTGMNVYGVLEDQFITDPDSGKEVSVAQMMKTHKYGKIYFMVGINELGTGNTGTFQKAYDRVIRKFRKWQPDAVIYIQGIIPVSKKKASSDAIFNNININDKNVAIAHLADGRNIFYLDVSGKLTDKKGYLKEDYTFDDVHMYAQHYELWTNYLMKHAVVRENK